MAQVKVVIDGVPYYGSSDKNDDLIGAILQLHGALKDHGAPISKLLQHRPASDMDASRTREDQ